MIKVFLICVFNEEYSLCYLFEYECVYSMYVLFCIVGILSCCLLKLYYVGVICIWLIFFCNGKIVFINFIKFLDID